MICESCNIFGKQFSETDFRFFNWKWEESNRLRKMYIVHPSNFKKLSYLYKSVFIYINLIDLLFLVLFLNLKFYNLINIIGFDDLLCQHLCALLRIVFYYGLFSCVICGSIYVVFRRCQ